MTGRPLPCVGRRILVIGNPGSGKSVLASQLSAVLDLPLVDLDALFWGPGWMKTPDERFLRRVKQATQAACWVVDGVYPLAVEAVVADADVLIWLDLPFSTLLGRVVRRSLRRIVRREVICGGNRERWQDLFGRDSMPVYLARSYRSYRRRFADVARRVARSSECRVVHLRSVAEVRTWLLGHAAADAAPRGRAAGPERAGG